MMWLVFQLLVLVNAMSFSSVLGFERDLAKITCDEVAVRSRCRSTVICEGDHLVLRCGGGRIQVLSASFGRSDRRTCVRGRPAQQLQNTHCESPNALVPVFQSCNGHSSCELSATTAVFSDPCPGTYKYLTVTYFCVPPVIRSNTTCEGETASLSCEQGLVIHIHAANYGRTDSSTCSSGRPPSELSQTDCFSSNSLTVVSDGCEGTNTCSVTASNSVFSDPCVGTFKFLYIAYICVSP